MIISIYFHIFWKICNKDVDLLGIIKGSYLQSIKMKKEITRLILEENNISLNSDKDFNQLTSHLNLERSKGMDRDSTTLEIDSMDNIQAETINFFNVFKFSQRKFLDYLFGTYAALMSITIPGNPFGLTVAILVLIWTFDKASLKKFNEQDSKVLYTVYGLNGSAFIEDIQAKYYEIFQQTLEINLIISSLETLAEYQVIKQNEDGEIVIEDKIEIVKV